MHGHKVRRGAGPYARARYARGGIDDDALARHGAGLEQRSEAQDRAGWVAARVGHQRCARHLRAIHLGEAIDGLRQ